ncbi:MAG: NfeD family protein [Gammaproteobacteria bacterium]|nr:NfeD family protein [Gammaproteobacteria bacterium]MBU1978913.1 NfeD family protein [Gammaproteobacteria bacterium]
MAPYIYWFLLALILLALEMATGTFYMLVLGLALGVGGVVALLGLSLPLQLTLSAVTGIAGTVILRRMKIGRPDAALNQGLDIGQPVQVVVWKDDGTARVHYRGAEWDAEPESADTPRDQTLYIKTMRGSILILTHLKL